MASEAISRKWTRRGLLIGATTLGGVAFGGSLLAACGGEQPTPTAAPKPAAAAPQPVATAPSAATAQPAATAASAAAPKPTAAAAQPAATPQAAAKASDQAATVRIHVRAGTEAKFYDERLAAFMKERPKITVKQEPFPGNEYWQKVWTMHAGGTLGDVMWSENLNSNHYFSAANGTIKPIDPYAQGEKFDLSVYYAQSVEAGKFEGKLYGLPWKLPMGSNAAYYNENLFKAANVPFPTSDWKVDDVLQTAIKLTKDTTGSGKTDQFGILTSNGDWSSVRHWVNAFGGEMLDKEGKKILINSGEARAAIQFLADMYHKHKVVPLPTQVTGGSDQMFVSGKLAIYQNGVWGKSIGQLIKGKFEWSAALMPKGSTGIRMGEIRCNYMALTSITKVGDQGWEVAKWLCDKESGIVLGEGLGGQSVTCGARPDVFNSDRLINNPTYKPEVHKIFIKALEEGLIPLYAGPWNFRGGEASTALANSLDPIWLGKEQPTQTYLDGVAKSIQAILDKPRP